MYQAVRTASIQITGASKKSTCPFISFQQLHFSILTHFPGSHGNDPRNICSPRRTGWISRSSYPESSTGRPERQSRPMPNQQSMFPSFTASILSLCLLDCNSFPLPFQGLHSIRITIHPRVTRAKLQPIGYFAGRAARAVPVNFKVVLSL